MVLQKSDTQLKLRRQVRFKQAMRVKNGLIVSIGIGEYGPRPHDAEVPGFFVNLPVGRDVENLRIFAEFLNYSFLTVNNKSFWTKDEVMEFLEETVGGYFFDREGIPQYDGLIVSVSSHGVGNNVISSNYEMINRTEIHRCISESYPQIRVIPRIFIFDACDGTRDRKKTLLMEEKDSHSEDSPCVVDADKAGSVDLVDELEIDTEWNSKNKNPDYNLIVVHGANDGFVSKMQDNEMGSYLTYSFIKAVKQRIERNGSKGLGEILMDIQNVLHDKGKQMIKFNCFNYTANLRIERGKAKKGFLVRNISDTIPSSDDSS